MSTSPQQRGAKAPYERNEKGPIGTALVIGGGPAGALAAKTLADRNFSVTLCESYPAPTGSSEKRHAYVISLNPRALRALRRVGIDPLNDLDGGVANYAYVRHNGSSKARVINTKEPSVMVRRQKLTSDLLALAAESGAKIRYNETLVDIDFKMRKATFESKAESKTTLSYDLLVGADGVKSTTRTLLQQNGLLGAVRKEDDDMEYQVGILPNWRKVISPETAKSLMDAPDSSTHTWADKKSNSNSLLFPLDDGKSLLCLICPAGRLGAMKRDKSYGSVLKSLFPNWTEEVRSDLATQLAADDNVPTTGGTCIWASALGAPDSGVVLVGDSGHGMWPSLGQGCISALESVSVLADAVEAICGAGNLIPSAGAGVRGVDILDKTTGERARLIANEYQGLRHEDALAIVNMTFGGIGGRRVRGQQNSNIVFMLQCALMMLLNKVTCGLVPIPASLRLMKGDDVSYSTLLWQNQCEKSFLYAVLVAVIGVMASYLL